MIRYVYVAGPITKGNQFVNVRNALLAARRLRDAGFWCYVPHRAALDEIATGETHYEVWMEEDCAWISRSDALLRLPGESSGSDREVAHARDRGIPVFFDVEDLITLGVRGAAE